VNVITSNWQLLLAGAGQTLLLTVASALLATALGAVLALGKVFGNRALSAVIEIYLYIMRGVPLLVLLFAMYYVLPYAGLTLSPASGGILVLAAYFAAFMTEIFRGALLAVPRGQWDAARALGMYGRVMLGTVIVPQALRLVGPPYVNTLIMLVKGTSLVSVIGLWELTMAGRQIVERTLAAFEIFGAVAATYFVICYVLSLCGRYLESRTRYAH
jgi:His/Glu/Gln/Arg/opine family amino acid ABC transporter permease subunit